MDKNYVKSASGVLKGVLLCPPRFLRLEPINKIAVSWLNKGTRLDRRKCLTEHQQLIDIYRENAVEVELLEPNELLPSQTFSRDFGFNIKEGYVLGRFKERIRRPESAEYAAKLRALNIPLIAACDEGFIEGGDFWQLDEKTLAVGCVQRSNETGVENIRRQLSPLGYRIISVQADPEYLHLDMIFNIVGDRVVVTYYDALPEHFKRYLHDTGFDLIKVDRQGVFKHFCNLQALGNKRVISLKANKRVNAELRKRGFEVFELDAAEILKAGGGPHCMTFPLHRS
ncbi:dimethylarginine dimethylaminohydrolase family protein [Psychromonas ossibalaenae]|uniref:dimethylarginine dimethylaminohydrolase family protein n=1 Tax=Psychromonas ossibalaenae TaxID=444922 RepID=UPI0003797E0A|nr:arginine deiminase family protein [Psychromonas ossibalaenae]